MEEFEKLWGEKLLGVVLFGSAARGDSMSDSDIDLLMVLDSDFRINRSLYSEWDRIWEFRDFDSGGRQISPHFLRLPVEIADAGGLWYEVAIEGIVLWERHLLVSRFLQKIRRAIAAKRIERIEQQGYSYWVKNEEGPVEK
jgi:predicted nucleotidyltransferase